MRKLFTIFALLLGAISFVGCSSDDTPMGDTQPQISITQVAVTPDTFTFKVTTSEAGTIGYAVVAEGYETPKVDQWFTENSKVVKKSETITISNLNADTNYTLYAIFRAKKSGNLSEPQKVEFTTPDDGVNSPIVIHNATYDTISFSINIAGNYLFQCIDKPYVESYAHTLENYITEPGIGISSNGPIDVDWVNGGYYGSIEMRVREDCDYYVVVAMADSQGNLTGEILYKTVRTPKRPTTSSDVKVELTEVASTSVTIKTTPLDNTVSTYYVLVVSKKEIDFIIDNYGESILQSSIENEGSGRWALTAANEATWGGLLPNTEYVCNVVIKDNKDAKLLKMIPFTTGGVSRPAPEVEVSLTPASENGYCTLQLNIFSEDANNVRIAFYPLGNINIWCKNSTPEKIVNSDWYASALSADQVTAIKSTGLTITYEDLFPDVEYAAIVSVKNDELTETIKTVSVKTPIKPVPTRVESDLFTSLLGEWEVSYPLIQFNTMSVKILNAKVTIAAGADDETADHYRSYNRLVIQGWPFNVEADGTHNPMPYYSPADLKEFGSLYRDYSGLALRDYGPKIFLEIGEGDVISVPSARGEYLYNWAEDGTFYFFGADWDNGFTAPSPFPVTLSEDGNTLTIGACQSGAEFGYGIYRPAVFRNDLKDYRAITTDDIILKRVK